MSPYKSSQNPWKSISEKIVLSESLFNKRNRLINFQVNGINSSGDIGASESLFSKIQRDRFENYSTELDLYFKKLYFYKVITVVPQSQYGGYDTPLADCNPQTQRSVVDTVGVARSVVARMWNRFKETGNVRRRPGADESQFSLESDTRRVLVWRDRGTRNNPAFVRERSQYRRAGWKVWGGISIGGRTDLHIIRNGTLTGRRMIMPDRIELVWWRTCLKLKQYSVWNDQRALPDLNPIEHVWDMLGRRIAARPRPPATVRDLEIALLEEWNSIPKV
ncbi:transposable element Tcb2 transposase [Trichonephila clavipes]|nr:transposable element Tcb2 transposase [Trichonephila clavipes]